MRHRQRLESQAGALALDFLEKGLWVVTGLVVLVVVGLAYVGPLKSEISQETVADEVLVLNKDNKFLQQAWRKVKFNPSISTSSQPETAAEPARGGADAETRATKTEGGEGAARRRMSPRPHEPPPPLPPGRQDTVYIPRAAVEKYKHFEDFVELGMTASGDDVEYAGQTAFQIYEIEENSPLATQLGFQAGDIIISVNNYPVSKSNARQLYETLKDETHFDVVIDRGGQRLTIPYERH